MKLLSDPISHRNLFIPILYDYPGVRKRSVPSTRPLTQSAGFDTSNDPEPSVIHPSCEIAEGRCQGLWDESDKPCPSVLSDHLRAFLIFITRFDPFQSSSSWASRYQRNKGIAIYTETAQSRTSGKNIKRRTLDVYA